MKVNLQQMLDQYKGKNGQYQWHIKKWKMKENFSLAD